MNADRQRVVVHADVGEHQHCLVGRRGRLARIGGPDEQRAIETITDLLRGLEMRVIPEEPGVGHDEVVIERATRLDRRL